MKWAVTPSLVLDATYRTDFAQVEADEQQINLTRFSLFFPEKREFFLENQGIFNFGGANTNGTSDTPTFFYSRRIGLNQAIGRVVPIQMGGRLTGRAGAYQMGIVNIQTKEMAGTMHKIFFIQWCFRILFGNGFFIQSFGSEGDAAPDAGVVQFRLCREFDCP